MTETTDCSDATPDVTNTYNRLGSVTSTAGSFTYAYTPGSSLIASVTGPVHTVTITWEPNRDVLDVKENKIPSTNTTISSFHYGVNIIGQRTGVQTTGTAFPSQPADWTWGYHALGQVVVHHKYDPFGNLTRLTGSDSTRFAYRFSTKPRDPATGLYYYGYRWFDPYAGRWPSRDPIEEEGGVNLYGFVGNDAMSNFDVVGRQASYPKPPPNPYPYSGTPESYPEVNAGGRGSVYVDPTTRRFVDTPHYHKNPNVSPPPGPSQTLDPISPPISPRQSKAGAADLLNQVGGGIDWLRHHLSVSSLNAQCDLAMKNARTNHPRFFGEGCPACCIYEFTRETGHGPGLTTYSFDFGWVFLGVRPGRCADVVPSEWKYRYPTGYQIAQPKGGRREIIMLGRGYDNI